MATLNIHLPHFDKNQDWILFSEQLEHYFAVNNFSEEQKVSVLLTVLSPVVYKELRSSCEPVLPKNKTYQQLDALLRIHFSKSDKKSTNNVYEGRRQFYRAVQNDKDSVQQWYDRLKKMSTVCSFSAYVEDVLRDKFITGLRDKRIFNRLSQEPLTLNLNGALQIALKEEQNQNLADLSKKIDKKIEGKLDKLTPICYNCGGTKHNFKLCKLNNLNCQNCKQHGHIHKDCPNRHSKVKILKDLLRHSIKSLPARKRNSVGRPLTIRIMTTVYYSKKND